MPPKSARRASAGVDVTVKVVTSATRLLAARDVIFVAARAVVVVGRAAVVKGAIVAAQTRGAGRTEGARSTARVLKG